MPLRPATYRDLSTITDIFAQAFLEDGFTAWLMPHRYELPEHYHRAWRHKVLEHWWDYQKTMMVSYEIKDGKEVIIAAAQFTRFGNGWEELWGIKARWDPRLLVKPFLVWYHKLHRRVFPNRCSRRPTAEDPNPLTYWTWLNAVIPFSGQLFTPPNSTTLPPPSSQTVRTQELDAPKAQIDDKDDNETLPLIAADIKTLTEPATAAANPPFRPPFWDLSLIGTDPAHQGQGHGRALCKWGLDIARKENLPCSLVAAEHRERFYKKCGWTNLVGYATQGEGNPLGKLAGGAVMWTEWPWPKEVEEGGAEKPTAVVLSMQ